LHLKFDFGPNCRGISKPFKSFQKFKRRPDRASLDRLSPRLGVAWAPPRLQNTKISAGYAVIREASNLRLFTRPLDQYVLTTHFLPGGGFIGPQASLFAIDNHDLLTPTYRNLTASLEQRLSGGIHARLDYLRRRGENGLTYANALRTNQKLTEGRAASMGATGFDGFFELGNERRDVFDSVELTLRQQFRGQYDWMASYTRSRAFSNSVVDLSADSPQVFPSGSCPALRAPPRTNV